MSVLIKGGRVITAADDYVADVFVEGERISLIGESLDVDGRQGDRRDREVRAPGLRRPAHAPRHAVRRHGHDRRRRVGADRGRVRRHDDATSTSASRARARPSPTRSRPGTRRREGKQVIDMGYHIAVTDLREGGTLEELATLPDQGVTSYKLFMAYKGALHGRRRDALPHDGGRGGDRRARDGARRERRRDRRAREAGARRRATPSRTGTR